MSRVSPRGQDHGEMGGWGWGNMGERGESGEQMFHMVAGGRQKGFNGE